MTMVRLDWNKLLSVSADDLSDDEKEELYTNITLYNMEPNIDFKKLRTLFLISQTILNFKGNQVESLIAALDDLASKQGEEEARRHQDLIEEVEELRERLTHSAAKSEKKNQFSRNGSHVEDLHLELERCELQNNELKAELHAREQEILADKRDMEKLAGQVVELEQEKVELRRELTTMQHEATERDTTQLDTQDSPELASQKNQEMVESIRQKNKHISQLLNDVETIEKENVMLREKLSNLRDELSEATTHITEMTGELTGLKQTFQEQEGKLNLVEDQNTALRTQITELVEQKLQRDNQLDVFSDALDSRVQKWKVLMEQKNAEIEELEARLAHIAAQAPNIQIDTERSRVALLSQTLQKREEQIEDMQQKLSQATKELNESALVIEQFGTRKAKHRPSLEVTAGEPQKLKLQLQQTEDQVQLLEIKLKDCEEDAQAKAEEMTGLIIQLREYESGEYGLAEAVGEIKELRQQRKVRDKQIEELVQSLNKLQAEAGQLEEQNMALREKLGLPSEEPVRVDGILVQRKKEQLLMRVLQQQSERLEEEKLKLKLENRKLIQQVGTLCKQIQSLGYQPNISLVDEADSALMSSSIVSRRSESIDLVESREGNESQEHVGLGQLEVENQRLNQGLVFLEGKFRDVAKENEALRNGMHEILDSIHQQDGTSNVQLESKSLERLMEALDSRNISGWYHPAMRLQAQLHSLEGSSAVLREQLRAMRLEERASTEKLQKALLTIEQLEHSLLSVQEGRGPLINNMLYEELALPSNVPPSSTEVVDKLNAHLLRVLTEYKRAEERNNTLEKNLEEYTKKFNILRHKTGLLYEHHGSEKKDWEKAKQSLEAENEELKGNMESFQTKINEFERHWEALDQDEVKQKQLLSESAKKVAQLKANEVKMLRKCKSLQNMENQVRKDLDKMKEEMTNMKCTVTRRVGDLRRHKEMSSYQITALQSILEDSVPLITLEAANRQFNELTSKYRDLLQKEQSLICEGQLAARLEEEIFVLRKDKIELQNALQVAKEKLHSLESIVTSFNQDTVTQDTHDNQIALLSKKLATVDLKELHERQRANHADKMYNILKEQLGQLEERCAELEAQNVSVVQQNVDLQRVERQLRDNLLTFVDREELHQVQEALRRCETQTIELKLEKERLQEVGDIALEQVRMLEMGKVSQAFEVDYMKRQILDLQAGSDDKAIIAKLGHELLSARLSETTSFMKVQQLQDDMAKSHAQNLRLESSLDKKDQAINQLRTRNSAKYRSLYQVIQDLRQLYSGAVPLIVHQRVFLSLRQLGEERRLKSDKLRQAQAQVEEVTTKLMVLEEQMRSMQGLKAVMEASPEVGHKQVVEWHHKNSELRLKELKSRRRVEVLESRLHQAEERLRSQEEHMGLLEQDQLSMEKEHEHSQLLWEQMQNDLCKELADYEKPPKVSEPDSNDKPQPTSGLHEGAAVPLEVLPPSIVEPKKDETGNLANTHLDSLLKCEAELVQLKKKLVVLNQQMEDKETLLITKDKVMTNLQLELVKARKPTAVALPSPTHKPEPAESSEKIALKATVKSLQNIIGQKEETIDRYKNLIKENRDEHSQATSKLQQEVNTLHETLAKQQETCNALKRKTQRQSSQPQLPVVEQCMLKVHDLEQEVSELHTAGASLSHRLRSCRAEADRWKVVAGDRLRNMSELQSRLEEQHQAELQSYKEESERYRLECETCKRDLALLRQASQEGESLVLHNSMAILKAQLQEKTAREQVLSQTILDLQKEMKQLVDASAKEAMDLASSHSERSQHSALKVQHDDTNNLRKQLKAALSREKVAALELKTAQGKIHKLQDQLGNRQHEAHQRALSADSKVSLKEQQLQKKIKSLENLLEDNKQRHEKQSDGQEDKKIKVSKTTAEKNPT